LQDNPHKAGTRKAKPIWVLMKQAMMGRKWHQLDHTQIICTSHQTGNHISTSPLNFYWPDALPDTQPTVSKHQRQIMHTDKMQFHI